MNQLMIGEIAAAHPRACGENESVNDPNANMAGSSPRMRGKLDDG